MRTILFLCSGHLCRGRFAEVLFNHRAIENGLDWTAHSRGLMVDWMEYDGGVSAELMQALSDHDIEFPAETLTATQVTEADFNDANIIIALSEIEHRPVFRARYPDWEDAVEFWDIQDIEVADKTSSLPRLKSLVDVLIDDLAYIAVPV